MTKRLHAVALVTAAGALLVVPTIGQADPRPNNPHNHGKAQGKGKGKAKTCTQQKTVKKGFVVKGTLVENAPGTTYAQSVTISVTGANRHARIAAVLTDKDPDTPGVQYGNQTYSTPPGDSFRLETSGYEGNDTPSAGDKVRIIGKVPVTRKKCAPGKTLAQLVGDREDIRKVKIIDSAPDLVAPVL